MITGAFFCRPDEFVCNNTLCKLHSWVCDGEDDCGDNSDEDVELCGEKSNSDSKATVLIVHSYSINLYLIKAVINQSNTGLLKKIICPDNGISMMKFQQMKLHVQFN